MFNSKNIVLAGIAASILAFLVPPVLDIGGSGGFDGWTLIFDIPELNYGYDRTIYAPLLLIELLLIGMVTVGLVFISRNK